MKKIKKLIAFFVICIMLFSVRLAAAAAGSTGTIDEITRGEWIEALTVVFEMEIESDQMPDNYFADLEENSPYYEAVMLAVEFGVVDIEAGGEIHADDLCTREFAVNTLNYCMGFQLDEETAYEFSDAEACTNPENVQVALNRGWFALKNNQFMPQEPITLDEYNFMMNDAKAAAILMRYCQGYGI